MSVGLSIARRLTLLVVMLLVSTSLAFAQGGGTAGAIGGVVVDDQGGVIPGADVAAKNNGTGETYRAVTDASGRFTIPSVPPGSYTVTVSLMGFKTFVSPDVKVLTATPANLKATLSVGALEETVVVTGATEIVQTQTATVQTTLVVQQIAQLPVITRTALDSVVSMPGVQTAGSDTRGSTINGLPTTAINITLDGINVQDKRGNEGFFMYIRPMMDSVEEITVSSSNPEAASTGAGGASIRMETRSGTNRFTGSAYNTWRNQAGTTEDDVLTRTQKRKWMWRLNTPYWFDKRDKPKTAAGDEFINDVRLQTPGFRVGGPIQKDKLFYFFHTEWFLLPETRSRTRYLLNEQARQGLFTYPAGDGSGDKTIDLLALAARYGQTSTLDPTIAKLLAEIRQATTTAGATSAKSQNVDQYDFSPSATQKRVFPTLRIDYNLTNAHRITFSTRYNDFNSTPDFLNNAEERFPGFPNLAGQVSGRYMWQGTVRSTLSSNMVNEFRVGAQNATGLGTYFGKGVNASQFNCTGIGCQSAGGNGWSFSSVGSGATLGLVSLESVNITGATAYNGQSSGVASQFSIENRTDWLRGRHSLSMGVSFNRISMRNWNSTPTYATLTFGTASNDKTAYDMLDANSGNYPGTISTTYAGYARTLYGLLTGRVTGIAGTAYLQNDGSYVYQGERTNATRSDSLGLFVSDSWKVKPNLTVNAGLRYQLQFPMSTDGAYSRPETWQMVYGITGAGTGQYGQGNLYRPGVFEGVNPLVVPYENNRPAYNTDKNNLSPSIGVAWRPNIKSGILAKILSTDPVIRGGYSITYTQLGTNFFDGNYSGNPGRTRTASRGATTGDPVLGYDGWPVLLRDAQRLYPSSFPSTAQYPIVPKTNETLDIHYPDWPVPYTHQYSLGFQRSIGKSMGLDVRYVGNTNVGGWTTFNMVGSAQWSMLSNENGFYDEFRRAQANLYANVAAGKGTTFAYTGAPGTSPLPIFMAYLHGIPLNDPRNQDPTKYTHANFKSSSWYNSLRYYSPALTTIAGTGSSGLQNGINTGTGLDANRIAAGLPANFFIANPAVAQGNAYLETTAGNTRFNSLQFELRRQMSKGLLIMGSYSFQFGRKTWSQNSLRESTWHYIDSTGGPTHALKLNWLYELPFGQGRRFGGNAGPWMNRVIGGWSFDGVARIQSGAIFNFGGYRLVGMTEQELQDMFKIRFEIDPATGKEQVFWLPRDVIDNSMIALNNASASTVTGYTNNVVPTGRYIAPASGSDCVQYLSGMCPGTVEVRKITGPMYWKVDLSFKKRIALVKNMRIEGVMDLFNVFDVINFNAIGVGGSTLNSWASTSGATDVNASQDPGGRITSFQLRFSW